MTSEERMEWIDKASYEELLRKWRLESRPSPWFTRDMGEYFTKRFAIVSALTSQDEKVAASKRVG